MKLDDRLDLSEHPASNLELVNLLHRHVFHNFERFRHAVANTTDGPQILHMLIGFMKHDVGMAGKYTKWKNTETRELKKMKEDVGRLETESQELEKDKERLRKKLDHSRQELDQTHKRLANSREEYTAIEKQLERVQGDLLATQAQLDKRSMSGTSPEQEKLIKRECAQRFELLDKLRAVNKENASLRKQLAGSSMASVAANPVASYRPRGIRPKN